MAKYNHLPFEDWVYSRETISPQEEFALQEHLKECMSCQSLVDTLNEVELYLKEEPVVSPQAGFTARWQTRLAEQRAGQQKRQTIIFMAFSITGALILLAMLLFFMLPIMRSPYPFLVAMLYQITLLYMYLTTFTQAGITVAMTIYQVVPPVLWIGLLIAMLGLAGFWLIAFGKLVYQRRVIS